MTPLFALTRGALGWKYRHYVDAADHVKFEGDLERLGF